jgi:hypothetical protein
MQGRNGAVGNCPENWEMKLVDMEVQDIEIARAITDPVEHKHVIGDWIENFGSKPQRQRGATYQLAPGDRITAGKQRNVVAQPDQLFSEV